MNIKEAIETLQRANHRVQSRYSKGSRTTEYRINSRRGHDHGPWESAREIIRFARHYTSDDKRNTKLKKSVKHEDRRKNRQATRQMIHHEKWDEYPLQGKIKTGNLWNWD